MSIRITEYIIVAILFGAIVFFARDALGNNNRINTNEKIVKHAVSKSIVKHEDIVVQILRNGDKKIAGKECLLTEPDSGPYFVADFIMGYFTLLASANRDTRAGFIRCGFIDDNICELYYSVEGVVKERGTTWHLRFSIDPDSKKINPNSFECWVM